MDVRIVERHDQRPHLPALGELCTALGGVCEDGQREPQLKVPAALRGAEVLVEEHGAFGADRGWRVGGGGGGREGGEEAGLLRATVH